MAGTGLPEDYPGETPEMKELRRAAARMEERVVKVGGGPKSRALFKDIVNWLPADMAYALVNYHHRSGGSIEGVKAIKSRSDFGNVVGQAFESTCRDTGMAFLQRPCSPPRTRIKYESLRKPGAFMNEIATMNHEFGHQIQTAYDGMHLKDFFATFEAAYRKDLTAAGFPKKTPEVWKYILPKKDKTGVISDKEWRRASMEGFAEIFANSVGPANQSTDFLLFPHSTRLVKEATQGFMQAFGPPEKAAPAAKPDDVAASASLKKPAPGHAAAP